MINVIGFFSILVLLVFVAVFAVIIVFIVRGVMQWGKNNNSPVITVNAVMVTKRMNVSHHNHAEYYLSSTTYYATFEVESGNRMEFVVQAQEYGMLVERDNGRLTFQGTRYLGFERFSC